MNLLKTQSRGVMVAQMILVHLVEVRVLAGLPFFCLLSTTDDTFNVFSTI